ncbi:hypothetical protein ACFLZ6_02470 [Nanoarchaeota archaeon]
MLDKILVALGIILLTFSSFMCGRVLDLIKNNKLRKRWYMLCSLIWLFLIGYVFFLYSLITSKTHLVASNVLICSILFSGAIFVVLVLDINFSVMDGLSNNASNLGKINRELNKKTKESDSRKNSLVRAKKELEKKNEELEKTLMDFYTMRIGLQKDLKAGKVEEENRKIKERIDKLKRIN